MKINIFQEQFNGGELGRELAARYDLPQYKKSLKTLKNFRPMLQGGIKKRNGTRYKYNCKYNNKKCRLIPFIFNETDNFVIEMGENYFRFIDSGSQVLSGGSPYEVAHTYTESQLPLVKYRQIADIVYIVHPEHPPRKLTRIAPNNWTLQQVDFIRGPVADENSDESITLHITSVGSTAAKDQTCTITANSSIFDSSQIGFVFRFKNADDTRTGYAKMTGYTSGAVAEFLNQTDNSFIHGSGNAVYRWSPPAFSGENKYPRAIAFHEQRLVLAGSEKYPLTIWGSVTGGAYENFEQGTDKDDAFAFELAGQINVIQWLVSDGLYLTAGTLGGIGFIGSGDLESTLSPTNVKANLSSSYGASSVDASLLSEQVLYLSSNRKTLYELHYEESILRYKSVDITSHNLSVLAGGGEYTANVEQPDLSIFIVSNGELVAILRDKLNEVAGWYTYTTNGDIESIAVIPTATNDQVWLTVLRNGNRYIEVMAEEDSNIFLDSAIEYTGSSTRTLSGLSHLEGMTVSVLGNNSYAGDYVVTGGAVTLPPSNSAVTEAIIGLPYAADAETMPADTPSAVSSTVKFLKKRINRVKMILDNTGSFKIGRDFNNLKVVPIRKTTDNMNQRSSFFGSEYPSVVSSAFDGCSCYDPTFCLRSDLPFPCTLVGLGMQIEIGED